MSSTPQVPHPWGRPTALPSMATDPPGRLTRMRKAGDEQRLVYYGNMDDQKDSESSECSAAISVASSKEERLRGVQNAAVNVRKLVQFSELTYVRCTRVRRGRFAGVTV